ncbi:MAG: radical SAM protein [Christensenellaceae bacterium]|nr:radical SAM protein [Christensenellaceae bacterium]MEA5066631.1 radical SAM protein [Eubacteriales bacterium]MEA5069231.1 radical SAM protein [Christensenellaceae bacterium]
MQLRYFQKGFNYAQDGPGNRLVYHLTGCNMRCPWCANPEGMAMDAPCRTEPVEAVAQSVVSARPMFFDGGGLTLTGGEVTAQPVAARALLDMVRREGVHTCVETNAANERLHELLPLIDLLIADFKHPDDEAHRRFTGLSNALVRRNLMDAARAGHRMLVRVPLIHGVNDDDGALNGFTEFFEQLALPGVRVEILPYHEYGRDKWIRAYGRYDMRDAFVSAETVRAFERAFEAAGMNVVRT